MKKKSVLILVIIAVLLFFGVRSFGGGATVQKAGYSISCSTCKGSGDCHWCSGSGRRSNGRQCTSCQGSGKCHMCNGAGSRKLVMVNGREYVECPACHGTGSNCWICHGRGYTHF